jgi:hypothetical protein
MLSVVFDDVFLLFSMSIYVHNQFIARDKNTESACATYMTKIINAKTSSKRYTRVIVSENKIQLKHAMII